VRAYNCLKRAGITKVGEILKRMEKGEDEMLAIRNFGKKSLDELVEKLREKNYLNVPGVDLSYYIGENYRTATKLTAQRARRCTAPRGGADYATSSCWTSLGKDHGPTPGTVPQPGA
jgi:hypothetical protein